MAIPRESDFCQIINARKNSTGEFFMFTFTFKGDLVGGCRVQHKSNQTILHYTFGQAPRLYEEMITDETGDWEII